MLLYIVQLLRADLSFQVIHIAQPLAQDLTLYLSETGFYEYLLDRIATKWYLLIKCYHLTGLPLLLEGGPSTYELDIFFIIKIIIFHDS